MDLVLNRNGKFVRFAKIEESYKSEGYEYCGNDCYIKVVPSGKKIKHLSYDNKTFLY